MRLEICNRIKETEPVLRLALTKLHNNNVALVTVDEKGDSIQTLLSITTDGEFIRHPLATSFITKCRISCDDSGRIMEKTY